MGGHDPRRDFAGAGMFGLTGAAGLGGVITADALIALRECASRRLFARPRGYAFNHLTPADTFEADKAAENVTASEYDGLVLPGGVASPDFLRTQASAVRFTRSFFDSGRPVAAICHAPWTMIDADVVRGRTITSWPSLRTDLVNAGANWVDEEVVVCSRGPNTLVSSRKPDDLPAFCTTMVGAFAAGR